jgi:hypothetical protein
MNGEYEGPPLEIELYEAFGVIADSFQERRRLRLLNTEGVELASVTGVLAGPDLVKEEGEDFAELLVCDGGLSVRVKIALDPETRCTISPDGTLTGVLPSGATWITTPRWAESGRA